MFGLHQCWTFLRKNRIRKISRACIGNWFRSFQAHCDNERTLWQMYSHFRYIHVKHGSVRSRWFLLITQINIQKSELASAWGRTCVCRSVVAFTAKMSHVHWKANFNPLKKFSNSVYSLKAHRAICDWTFARLINWDMIQGVSFHTQKHSIFMCPVTRSLFAVSVLQGRHVTKPRFWLVLTGFPRHRSVSKFRRMFRIQLRCKPYLLG